jgi:RHS repeat-associated protein
MKTKLTLTLLAFATVSLNLHAAPSQALPAPLPELMNDAQATKWTADQEATAKTAAATQEVSTQFYTGKPFVANAGGYVFKYRTYNPEMSRWTSADPSGFPDGVNNQIYAKNEASYALDNDGLTATSIYASPNTTQTGSGMSTGTYSYTPTGGTAETGFYIVVTVELTTSFSTYSGGTGTAATSGTISADGTTYLEKFGTNGGANTIVDSSNTYETWTAGVYSGATITVPVNMTLYSE